MIWKSLGAAVTVASLAVSMVRAGEPAVLKWSNLVDEAAQQFEDPYRDLALAELSDLVSIVRLQDRLEAGDLDKQARPRVEARIAQKRGALEAAGIDIEWLLEQRWVVAERRERAAMAANPDLDGQVVQIGGYLIPAPPSEDGQETAYLVPERGMCSHTPPPPPNQLLRLIVDEEPQTSWLYAATVVRGTLRMKETRRDMIVVDGLVPMRSSWTLETEALEFVGRLRAPGAATTK
ncbi:MAG: DUF3299 domain-containing protein [Pseudomonadota bacterium]